MDLRDLFQGQLNDLLVDQMANQFGIQDRNQAENAVEGVGGSRQPENTSMLNGAGILKHLLGGSQNQVVEMLGKATGLHKSQAGQMLMSLAPVVMGMLGRQKRVNNLNENSLADLITRGTQNFNRQSPTNTSIITKILDRDGDGSAMDEIMSMGAKALFGSIFKG